MFTGLVETTGRLRERTRRGPGFRLGVETTLGPLVLGESIAVNGVCLTASALEAWGFVADVSVETVARTTLGTTESGAAVNLERALQLGARLGGHLVTGHVDGLVRVVEAAPAGEALRVRFALPAALRRFLAEKGSVCLDGVSLTVNAVHADGFEVMLVPHTLGATNLVRLTPGRTLNIEVDPLARYVARCLDCGSSSDGGEPGLGLLAALGEV